MQLSRMSFFKSVLAAGAFPYVAGCIGLKGSVSRGDKVRLACIGVGNQAWNDIVEFMKTGDAVIAALCDVDLGAKHTEKALATYPNVPRFKDFRRMFDAMEGKIDAVLVGTPDFSHFPATMDAIRRGIPVYVEKPLAHTFQECELLMQAEKKYNAICQLGNQGHSGANPLQMGEYVKKGIIDPSKLVRMVAHMNNPRRWHKWNGDVKSFPAAEKIPETLDWDLWLSQTLPHGYSKHYINGDWRCWYDFGMGCLGDWGAHTMDTMHRFFELGLPSEIKISDVKGWNPYVYPMQDTLRFTFEANGKRPKIDLEWYEGINNMPKLPKGYKYLAWGGDIPAAKGSTAKAAQKLIPGRFFELSDGSAWEGGSHSAPLLKIGVDKKDLPAYTQPVGTHWKNFLMAVKGEAKVNSPFSIGAPLSQVFCLGVIAQRLNRGFKFDPVTKRVVGDDVADALLRGPAPRKGWEEFYRV